MSMVRSSRLAALAWLLAAMLLSGCDALEAQLQAALTPTATPRPVVAASTPQVAQVPSAPAAPTSTAVVQASLPQAQSGAPAAQEGAALSEYERIVNQVYERNINAVVNLSYGGGTGSGFVIDRDGHIVTNNHVVENMPEINITFADGSRANGELLGTFPEGDIAVVRASRLPNDLTPVELGDSSALRVGQIVIAIGSPLGLQQTVTSGIVSALNRSIEDLGVSDPDSSLHGLIQTDAAINPGNSGGPLFDGQGRVVGMNTLIASPNQGNIGLGFAVPVNRIKRVAPQLISQGFYQRPVMGITIRPIIPELAEALNLPTTSGVMIEDVAPGGPAEQAGLRGATKGVRLPSGEVYPTNGDIIVAINEHPIRTIGDLRNVLETETDAGDTITVTFVREGRQMQTQLTLGGSR
ncbi:S1C family serine protease [Kallotenue papyrolyticum]|uniref:S1C family serine protease n=1 Tax=Kallotenue papyrolyticum TaxID=1325125 RepID=UPI000492E643|nr:trypsin-like peptidase domain-containing protein [Kallotenue papyrolyticum]